MMKKLLLQGEGQYRLAKRSINLSLIGIGAITVILEIDKFWNLGYQTSLIFGKLSLNRMSSGITLSLF